MPPHPRRGDEDLDTAATARDERAEGRDTAATRRDSTAEVRDLAADHRDTLAEERDRVALQAADELGHPVTAELLQRAVAARAAAAADRDHARTDRSAGALNRARAGDDRGRAGGDRTAGREDRGTAARYRLATDLDPLTGALHRGTGWAALLREMARATRLGHPLAVVFLDVDQMKAVNDRGGHHAGDELLRAVVRALRAAVGPDDHLVRHGGDEFLCIMAGTTPVVARARMDQVDVLLAALDPPASITAGIAPLRRGDTPDQLVARADDDLYRRKRPPRT